ncbi:MAG: glycerol-3-phosphate 1-O-acyltransferase PlsY [Candidatus Binatia bacterium]|nr:glycerol-3-phosphate 1-O-acyltransferase PlsY [Candidatus Binatia bacterium]
MTESLLWLVVGYACGSIPFGWILARARSVDVRRVGSGNIGATNVARALGWVAGLGTLLADAAKGAIPVLLAERSAADPAVGAYAALGAVGGHVFTPFLKFRGGKGVATAAGAMLVVAPGPLLGAMLVFFGTVYCTGYVSAGSLSAALVLPLFAWLYGCPNMIVLASALMSTLIWIRHRDNLYRIANGTEPKIAFRHS